ncbi:hypothetical protein BB561_001003 [Smittium simulii]|uniref:Uncharacterized protein n=1 Tax=Smittium simulii TaxID=133385 RepID=A0A2T9YWM0_9FUNG|nr:hypothetical protein BB561_001003 [Smittium simulii]
MKVVRTYGRKPNSRKVDQSLKNKGIFSFNVSLTYSSDSGESEIESKPSKEIIDKKSTGNALKTDNKYIKEKTPKNIKIATNITSNTKIRQKVISKDKNSKKVLKTIKKVLETKQDVSELFENSSAVKKINNSNNISSVEPRRSNRLRQELTNDKVNTVENFKQKDSFTKKKLSENSIKKNIHIKIKQISKKNSPINKNRDTLGHISNNISSLEFKNTLLPLKLNFNMHKEIKEFDQSNHTSIISDNIQSEKSLIVDSTLETQKYIKFNKNFTNQAKTNILNGHTRRASDKFSDIYSKSTNSSQNQETKTNNLKRLSSNFIKSDTIPILATSNVNKIELLHASQDLNFQKSTGLDFAQNLSYRAHKLENFIDSTTLHPTENQQNFNVNLESNIKKNISFGISTSNIDFKYSTQQNDANESNDNKKSVRFCNQQNQILNNVANDNKSIEFSALSPGSLIGSKKNSLNYRSVQIFDNSLNEDSNNTKNLIDQFSNQLNMQNNINPQKVNEQHTEVLDAASNINSNIYNNHGLLTTSKKPQSRRSRLAHFLTQKKDGDYNELLNMQQVFITESKNSLGGANAIYNIDSPKIHKNVNFNPFAMKAKKRVLLSNILDICGQTNPIQWNEAGLSSCGLVNNENDPFISNQLDESINIVNKDFGMDCYNDTNTTTKFGKNLTKIGEASYSEVFSGLFDAEYSSNNIFEPTSESTIKPNELKATSAYPTSGLVGVAVKVIPFGSRGVMSPSGDAQPTLGNLYQELVSSYSLSWMADYERFCLLKSRNMSSTKMGLDEKSLGSNFVKVYRVCICQGIFPKTLLNAWDSWKIENPEICFNRRPDFYSESQLYAILILEYAGEPLETANLANWKQAQSILRQLSLSLALAEHLVNFEHRDLHWGNIMIKQVDPKISFLYRKVTSTPVQDDGDANKKQETKFSLARPRNSQFF